MLFSLTSIRPLTSWLTFGFLAAANVAFGQFPSGQNRSGGTVPSTQQVPSAGQLAAGSPNVQMEIKPERLDPRMLILLEEWEARTADINTLQGVFRRYEYDSVFMTEKRAVGRYWFGSPDKARMDFQPDPDVEKNKAAAPDKPLLHEVNGKTYTVEVDDLKSWICTGKEILEVDHPQKQFSRMEIPPQYQGQRITDGPMPFLFGMKADSVKKRYKMAFGEKHDPASQVHIIAYPLVPALRKEFQKAELLLDPKTYLPQAVKLWDPSGNKETVYLFYTPEPFSLADKLRGPWSIYLGPPWKKIQDIKADPDQLPMQEKRTTSRDFYQRSATGNSTLKTQ